MNKKIESLIDVWRRWYGKRGETTVRSDVLGSYTGTPEDPDDNTPVQDVDDL